MLTAACSADFTCRQQHQTCGRKQGMLNHVLLVLVKETTRQKGFKQQHCEMTQVHADSNF
jgi:hypothetical protein